MVTFKIHRLSDKRNYRLMCFKSEVVGTTRPSTLRFYRSSWILTTSRTCQIESQISNMIFIRKFYKGFSLSIIRSLRRIAMINGMIFIKKNKIMILNISMNVTNHLLPKKFQNSQYKQSKTMHCCLLLV